MKRRFEGLKSRASLSRVRRRAERTQTTQMMPMMIAPATPTAANTPRDSGLFCQNDGGEDKPRDVSEDDARVREVEEAIVAIGVVLSDVGVADEEELVDDEVEDEELLLEFESDPREHDDVSKKILCLLTYDIDEVATSVDEEDVMLDLDLEVEVRGDVIEMDEDSDGEGRRPLVSPPMVEALLLDVKDGVGSPPL